MVQSEANLQQQVADYIRLRYPNAIFRSDYGAGIKLTARQGAIQKRQNGGLRGYPDMFIAEPTAVYQDYKNKPGDGLPGINKYYGLFIELKREGTRLRKKDGKWATTHISEQADMLDRLRFRGYRAEFAVGFDEARKIIDEYLKGFNERSKNKDIDESPF